MFRWILSRKTKAWITACAGMTPGVPGLKIGWMPSQCQTERGRMPDNEKMSGEELAVQFAGCMELVEKACKESRLLASIDLSPLQLFCLFVCHLGTIAWRTPSDNPAITTLEDIVDGLKLLADSNVAKAGSLITRNDIRELFVTARIMILDARRPAPTSFEYGKLIEDAAEQSCNSAGRVYEFLGGTPFKNPFVETHIGVHVFLLTHVVMPIGIADEDLIFEKEYNIE